ncbi:acyl-CoA synthetase (AMP-forming)/AMP-acid ligase II [Streptomyces brevispora]|uniref:Acyl-CoA synthetase (AMP-forming)/AMP-acid ligase II n=1 Tax=Streptomyces brevispora TaxID=887462 RepID=A0A561UWF0_9ACTN|nr:AMP-binding protein [Streptomyces brevispora]TWG03699.1 acyl-CoA synthetase (AMP-forming)/AMP-acid ligase II [Streptomyces brevispora]
MSSGRPELARRILSQGVRVDGETLDAAGSPFEPLVDSLGRAGVRPGDVVVLSGLEGRALVTATVAAWRLDAVPMPVPGAGVTADQVVRDACRVTGDLSVVPRTGERGDLALATTAVLHLSSGSTDRPKVTRRGVASVLYEATGYRTGLALVPGDRVAVPVPLVHSFGWGVAMGALLSGVDIEVTPFVRAGTLARRIDSGAVSVLALTPPLARLLTATRRGGESRPRAAMAGAGRVGDELDTAFRERFGVPLLRGYGCSETGGTFFGERGMGRPVFGVGILRPPPGARGELVLRLPAPVEGYLGDHAPPGREWRSGDIVRHDADGSVHFVERVRGPLRLNGRFVRTESVEKSLRAVAGVRDVFLLVLPRAESPECEDFHAVVEGEPAEADLIAALSGNGGGPPVPRVLVCREMPRTTVGKPDRNALTDMVRKGREAA